MKTVEELKQYYEVNLLPDLSLMEEQRLKTKRKLIPLIIIAAALCIISLGIIAHFSASIMWMIIPLCICFVLFVGWYFSFYREFLSEFKDKVIQKIVYFIDPDLQYEKSGCVPKSTFVESKIFNLPPDYYHGDDFVSGRIGKTDIQFSELNVKHVEKTRSAGETTSSNKKQKATTYPIFRGMFFVADFNKEFTGTTVVLPDKAEKSLGRLGQKLQSMNIQRGELIKLEDPEFEKTFVVYGDNQIESRYILSTSLMKRIVDFKNKKNKEIFVSFAATRVYVAIPYEKTLFEPALFKTLIDFSLIREYYEDLQVALEIVEDLNLNTRIWSKQ